MYLLCIKKQIILGDILCQIIGKIIMRAITVVMVCHPVPKQEELKQKDKEKNEFTGQLALIKINIVVNKLVGSETVNYLLGVKA